MSHWHLCDVQNDDELFNQIIDSFTELYQTFFNKQPLVNHNLPVEIRAFRHSDNWRIFLLLTPWTLARIFIPERDPQISIPPDWQAEQRLEQPITVIGPAVHLPILGGREQAHLNYHPKLGHYLIQPLIQSMEQFKTPEDAFNAWNEVIKTRNRVIEEQKRNCQWQQEVSRREFFAKLLRRASLSSASK